MSKAILGKIRMTQVFTAEGQLVPVTVVETTPSVMVRGSLRLLKQTTTKAVQIVTVPLKKTFNKTCKGQFDKA